MRWETHWTFETPNFTINFDVAPADMDPADSFQFEEDIAAVHNGDVEWFCCRVMVYGPDGDELGRDDLGGCAYKTIEEFYTSHRAPDPANRNSSLSGHGKAFGSFICHYFPEMVTNATEAARKEFARRQSTMCAIKLRVV